MSYPEISFSNDVHEEFIEVIRAERNRRRISRSEMVFKTNETEIRRKKSTRKRKIEEMSMEKTSEKKSRQNGNLCNKIEKTASTADKRLAPHKNKSLAHMLSEHENKKALLGLKELIRSNRISKQRDKNRTSDNLVSDLLIRLVGRYCDKSVLGKLLFVSQQFYRVLKGRLEFCMFGCCFYEFCHFPLVNITFWFKNCVPIRS